jgi:hypothetical protein
LTAGDDAGAGALDEETDLPPVMEEPREMNGSDGALSTSARGERTDGVEA